MEEVETVDVDSVPAMQDGLEMLWEILPCRLLGIVEKSLVVRFETLGLVVLCGDLGSTDVIDVPLVLLLLLVLVEIVRSRRRSLLRSRA